MIDVANRVAIGARLASFLPDMPLYYPFVDPSPSLSRETAADVPTDDFAQRGIKKQRKDAPFQRWSIADYTSRYQSGELTPLQVARAVLAAIEESDKGETPLRAFVEVHKERVLHQAKESTARYAAKKPLGVLDGVPIAVKDEVCQFYQVRLHSSYSRD